LVLRRRRSGEVEVADDAVVDEYRARRPYIDAVEDVAGT
jgi:hypothetical protein